jgi:hypothetical protein
VRLPVCVHAARSVSSQVVLGTLADLEGAARALIDAIGAPPPLPDDRLGGGPAFDLYLVRPELVASEPAGVMAARDDALPGPFDRTSAFGLVRSDLPAGCVRQNLVSRTLAAAIQWGLDAGEDPGVRAAIAAYLAELVAPCGQVTSALIDDFQTHPERALFSRGPAADPAVAVAFPWYLDSALGRSLPGSVPLGFAAIGTQATPPDSALWNNEPDLLDVLRATLQAKNPPLRLDDLWLDFAIARLFMGARDDGLHFPESTFAGDFGRVRFDWSLPFATLPRRVAPERPIEPTGATYLFVGLEGAPPGARLLFRLEWEAPVVFRWALIRIRADGSEASRVLITPEQKSTSAEKNLDELDGMAGVVVVGVNAGDLRPDEVFDPDARPYEPHSYMVTIARTP